jgi:aspartyl-tRNA(Asn)/glutamyl-tRNA(Gln) amidotransferase subunit A
VGVRPTNGLVPRDGVFPGVPTLDRVGPIGRTVDDAEALLCCIAGITSTMEPATLSGVRIGVLAEWLAQAEVGSVVAEAVGALASLGAQIVEVTEPVDEERVTAAYRGLALYELAAQHGSTPTEHNPRLAGAIAAGRATSRRDYAAARHQVRDIALAWRRLIETDDLAALVGPTVPMTACTPEELPPLEMTYGRFTVPISLAGLPVVTQPVGFAGGLPVGMQWIGRPGHDRWLLAAARSYESVSSATAD